MPEISRFFGIIIKMFFDDHPPPHFHAEYGGDLALIDIRRLAVFSGRLPPRVTGLVIEGLRSIRRSFSPTGRGRGRERNSRRSHPWNENGSPLG
jgi:hypothetical protein